MEQKLPSYFRISDLVGRALRLGLPVVALESTVITHGLPYPDNLQLAYDMESVVREEGATPATVALIDGKITVGVEPRFLELLARGDNMHKISTRDLSVAAAKLWSGGTTVASTLAAAHMAGLRVFATGGIGGVHRPTGGLSDRSTGKHQQTALDISADLPQLARTPMVVVCAGAKAILDLPATLEYLETVSVPVVGYGTDDFPAFYSRRSGLKTPARADTPEDVAAIARAHWELGLQSAILVTNPPPEEAALPARLVSEAVRLALRKAGEQNIRGPEMTPFLLEQVKEATGGESLQANLALLKSNARVAARIAAALSAFESRHWA